MTEERWWRGSFYAASVPNLSSNTVDAISIRPYPSTTAPACASACSSLLNV